ncbi:MAG: phospholipase C, phosphocholine-specific [Sterolibacteriaceae bacterium]|nr:phospholipase C, phosphocholine-specific [Sterolibacteriaceae bacterium]
MIARALAIPANNRTGTIADVGHVVILTQENRSFDHYFGTMPGVRGFGDRFTIPLPGGRSVWEQSNGTRIVMPYHLDGSTGNAQRVDGTPHTWDDAQAAWDNGRMAQWPLHKRDHSMGYYRQAEVAFQHALADAFTLCDAYHCSLQAGTNPNRLFLWSGSNGPTAANVAAVVNEWDSPGPPDQGYQWKTYPERLEEAGVSWKVYHSVPDNFTDNPLVGFRQYRAAAAAYLAQTPGATPLTPHDDSMAAFSPLLKGVANTMPDGVALDTFRADILAGRLAQVSWLVAPESYCEHPDPSSPVQGGWYMQQVLNALTARPEVWSKTVLFVNYDENDGFFDHLPPPAPPSLNPDGSSAGRSTCEIAAERHTHAAPPGSTEQPAPDGRVYGMGPRVPMLVISPWSRGGWVHSQVFDHTSVIRFLEQRFGVIEPNISAWRRAVAGDLTTAFDFANPNAQQWPALPTLDLADAESLRAQQEQLAQVAVPAENSQAFPPQPRGIRPSRALPYDLNVDDRANEAIDALELDFINAGTAGAVLQVYDRLHLERIPRRFTVEAGKRLTDAWDTGAGGGRYDLWVIGPNGFHRHFSGSVRTTPGEAHALPEVQVRHDPNRHALIVSLTNRGSEACVFVAGHLAYQQRAPQAFLVDGGTTVEWRAGLTREHGWYDIQVALENAPGFARRFAGRLETGRHDISDPAMGRP